MRSGILGCLALLTACGPDCERDEVVDEEPRTFVEEAAHEVCPGDVLRFRPDGHANADVLLKARGEVEMVIHTKRGRAVPVEGSRGHFRVYLSGSGIVNGEPPPGDPHDELEVLLAEGAGRGVMLDVAHVGEVYGDVFTVDDFGDGMEE